MPAIGILIGCLVLVGLTAAGCEQKPTAQNAQEAIDHAKTKQTIDSQVDYLADQARGFINSKEYEDAIQIANYILTNLDQDSKAARDILEKAKAQMQKTAQGAIDDVKKEMNNVLGTNQQ